MEKNRRSRSAGIQPPEIAETLYTGEDAKPLPVRTHPLPIRRLKHQHYFKQVTHLREMDVYRVLDLFHVEDPAIAHVIKKLLVAGGRGAGKDLHQDVQEAIDTLERWQEMRAEDAAAHTA
jgi:hypothetical protein